MHQVAPLLHDGGDADTIAAMTGSISEAYYGIPVDLVADAFDRLVDQTDHVHVYNNSVLADELRRFWAYLEKRGMKSPRPAGF